uniref:Uncharacterized protein n=1 Tax=Meloidogyne enterolobii TaxID=390850 RepID=A0A6V7UMZ5_MELEN|nr:unnamed protein product [Meloidogyne enterolobii]
MKIFLYFFLLFYLKNLFQWQFVGGMEGHRIDRKGKAVMGSSSRSQQVTTNVITHNPEEHEFSLPQLTFLIEILKKIQGKDLDSETIFIEVVNHYSEVVSMENQLNINIHEQMQQKIKMVN